MFGIEPRPMLPNNSCDLEPRLHGEKNVDNYVDNFYQNYFFYNGIVCIFVSTNKQRL